MRRFTPMSDARKYLEKIDARWPGVDWEEVKDALTRKHPAVEHGLVFERVYSTYRFTHPPTVGHFMTAAEQMRDRRVNHGDDPTFWDEPYYALNVSGAVVFKGTGEEVYNYIQASEEPLFPKSVEEFEGRGPRFWLRNELEKRKTMEGMILAHGRRQLEDIGIDTTDLENVKESCKLAYQYWQSGNLPIRGSVPGLSG
jgi:hypothetical protein